MANPPAVIQYTQITVLPAAAVPNSNSINPLPTATTQRTLHRFRIIRRFGRSSASIFAANDGASTSASAANYGASTSTSYNDGASSSASAAKDGASTSTSYKVGASTSASAANDGPSTSAANDGPSTSTANDGALTSSSASGSASASASTIFLPVHKAVCISSHHDVYRDLQIHDIFLAVICINVQEEEAFRLLQALVNRSRMIPDHKNIVGIKYEPFTHKGCFCAVFPFMGLGSMKSVMAKKFPEGIPPKGILVILKEILTALKVIHERDLVHREICSAHIYLYEKPEIKLGFAASVFDLDSDQDSVQSSSIHIWAAAPESYCSTVYTKKSDVWAIGITAMELAYGGVKFMNRQTLTAVLDHLRRGKTIPEKSINVPYSDDDDDNDTNASLDALKCGVPTSVPFMIKSKFSDKFKKMVLKCIADDPDDRPTVDKLLNSKIFRKLNKDVSYFHDLYKNKDMD